MKASTTLQKITHLRRFENSAPTTKATLDSIKSIYQTNHSTQLVNQKLYMAAPITPKSKYMAPHSIGKITMKKQIIHGLPTTPKK